LSWEEEDAIPHHPSLDALSDSAKDCPNCRLIFFAIGCTIPNLEGMVSFKGDVELPSGHKAKTKSYESNINRFGVFRAMENGAMVSSSGNEEPDLRSPVFIGPLEQFQKGSNIQPWLFGNWWKFPMPGWPPQLIGFVGITADIGQSRALLSDRQCHFYGSYRSVPEAFYTGISTVLSVSPVLCNYRASCI
jgi:hypothetical protein